MVNKLKFVYKFPEKEFNSMNDLEYSEAKGLYHTWISECQKFTVILQETAANSACRMRIQDVRFTTDPMHDWDKDELDAIINYFYPTSHRVFTSAITQKEQTVTISRIMPLDLKLEWREQLIQDNV